MTPIPFDLPAGRILPPTTAYATGLVCEHRPDLADQVRRALLVVSNVPGEKNPAGHLRDAAEWCAWAKDEQGANALNYLREIVQVGGDIPKALHRLADVLFDSFQWCAPTANFADLALPMMYLQGGFAPCWQHAKTPNDLRCLRRLIPLHAHTVSLDADVRAAWAKAHLDAIDEPVRPMSPDRLN